MSIHQVKQPFQYEKIPLTKQTKEKGKKTKNTWKTIKGIWAYLKREKLKLTFVILMVMISSILSLLGPYMIGMAVDDFIVKKHVAGLGTLILLLSLVYIGHSVSIFLQNYWMVGIA